MSFRENILETAAPEVFLADGFVVPELLAPAGDWDCAKAAVENGADAIYFGLERFNARMRAHNFTETDLPKLMEFLHRRGVKGYVTFNTLVFANELAEAERHLRSIISAGADAAIVQDVGICRLIRELSPDFPIHASTQMTISSAAGVEFARELGCNLVVLARECSIKEIEKIQKAGLTQPGSGSAVEAGVSAPEGTSGTAPLPLEVFVHGALCVAYSGQCLTSEALGGRSANRGECAQACRMPYELVSDHHTVPLGDRRYLLSPQDLAGLDLVPDLIRAGVASLKIEGRLKSSEYVANITRIYRQALDKAAAAIGQPGCRRNSADNEEQSRSRYQMEMAFSRGLYTGWLGGINNQALVHGRFGKKRGVFLGEVTRIHRDKIFARLESPLKPGDGVVFDAGHPDEEEQGGRIYAIKASGAEFVLEFGHGDIDLASVKAGDKLWKTSDPELDRQLRQTFAGDQPRFQRPLDIDVYGEAGQPMVIIARDEKGNVLEATSTVFLIAAEKQPLDSARLREQMGRLGGTPFKLGTLTNRLGGEVILPVSELNRMRREIVSRMESLRAQPKRWTLRTSSENHFDWRSRREETTSKAPGIDQSLLTSVPPNLTPDTPQLIVLVRSMAQLEATLSSEAATIYCEFEDPKRYREAVDRFRSWQAEARGQSQSPGAIFVAPPRIFKEGEEWIFKQVSACAADGYLVRNYDHLKYFKGVRRIGDFSLNIANGLAVDYFIQRFGLERVTASYDLNSAQLEALLQSVPPACFEVVIHQHIPMFHMEHCLFCAFLSSGTDYTNCGRPCDRHELKLRDRVGAEHVVKADAGCRNTVFNARAQTGAEYVARMLALGARYFRIEFVNETPDEVKQTISKYRRLLRGEISGREVWRELKLLRQLGVTRGPMEKGE